MSYHLNPEERKRIVERIVKNGASISEVSRELKVSRPTIYKWLRSYKDKKDREKAYESKTRSIDKYYGQATEKQEELVRWAVRYNPAASKYTLSALISSRFPEHSLGPTGVYKVLKRMGLNLPEARIAYAKAEVGEVQARPGAFIDRVRYVLEQFIPSLAPAPPPPPSRRRFKAMATERLRRPSPPLEALAKWGKPFFISSFLVFFLVFGTLSWIRLLGAATPSQSIGLVFATTALLMGSFFFLYSFKYYITLALVLSFSQSESAENIEQRTKGKRSFLSWILGLNGGRGKTVGLWPTRASGPVGLTPNLEHIKLKRYPVISIHIPFYNEKNVVERAIAAATNFDYPGPPAGGYEVVLCDDSTDETTKIIEDYLKKNSLSLSLRKGDGYTLTSGEVRPGVVVKHLHRTSRSGYKGGALRLALRLCDPRTEFICVFDADFVPYPDTLELFLKYFQATSGTLDFKKCDTRDAIRNTKEEERISSHVSRISNIAAVQGYQWHVLNKSENWITRGIRSEYAGSYVIERSGTEIYGGLKMISGSVYMIRRDVLEEVGWETSITEDFQLTLKLYEKGYKVVYTPYVQAPAECVSTLKRLIRQRMRWAEGHSNNVRKMFTRLLFGNWEDQAQVSKVSKVPEVSRAHDTPDTLDTPDTSRRWIPSPLTLSEKLEFLYLSPYYLQAFFFLVGTISWLISETVFPARLPFWTSLWGWSLVLTNMLSLPLMNAVGLFLEESEEKDYSGLASFVALSYIMVPFQAYSSLKGFLKGEGPWFRTPKTGRITDVLKRGTFYRFISGILPGRSQSAVARQGIATRVQGLGKFSLNPKPYTLNPYLSLATANNRFESFSIKSRKAGWIGNLVILLSLFATLALSFGGGKVSKGRLSDLPIQTRVEVVKENSSLLSQIQAIFLPRDAFAVESFKEVVVEGIKEVSIEKLTAIALLSLSLILAFMIYLFRKKRSIFKKVVKVGLVFTLVFSWLFASWPPISKNPRFPPRINEAQAATLYEYYNTGDSGYFSVYGASWRGQTFTPATAHKITSVKLLLGRYGDSPGTFTISIRATDASGLPTGADLCSGTTDGNTLPTGSPYEWREITLGAGCDLAASTTYAIVARALSGTSSNFVKWCDDDSSPTYTGGSLSYSNSSGSTWTNYTAYDFMFEDWGEPPLAFNQSAYRWFNNANSTDVGTVLANQDTAFSQAVAQGTPFRLRLLLHVSNSQLDTSGQLLKLQIAQRGTDNLCDTAFSGETYADLSPTAGAIRYYDNSTPADAAALTANANDPTHGADDIVNQTYEEANNFTNSVAAIPAGDDGKWDFAMVDNSASQDTTYCLRVVKSDGTTLDTYTVIPEFTTVPENSLLLFGLYPLFSGLFKRMRKKKRL